MNKNLKWLSLRGFLAVTLLFAADLSAQDSNAALDDELFQSCMNTVKSDCMSWAMMGGGSEAPRGLSNNSKAELAMGERYILTGTISIISNTPFLRISFAEHPWLASRVRLNNPFYRIHDDAARWINLQGSPVTIVVTARYTSWVGQDGRMMFEILLEPSADSIIDGIQPGARRQSY